MNNRIERNVVTASAIDGIALVPSTSTRVIANDSSGNARAGVALSDAASDNVIEHNILKNNGENGEGHGIVVSNGTNNTIRNNTANLNVNGISVESSGNLVVDNTVSGSTSIGIAISSEGMPSTVRRNAVFGSGETDMSDATANCGTNTWRANSFQTDLVATVPDGGHNVPCLR